MAATLFLMERAKNSVDEGHRNGVQACILNADSAQTLAQNNVTALAIMNANEGAGTYPADYFTSQQDIAGAVPAGTITAGDVIWFTGNSIKSV
jgi:hypothetical protein